MNENSPLFWLWVSLATLAGAVTSLTLRPYRQMQAVEIALALFVSATFAMFVGSPIAAEAARWWGKGHMDLRAFGLVMWVMAAGSHFLIPVVIGRAKVLLTKIGGVVETDK